MEMSYAVNPNEVLASVLGVWLIALVIGAAVRVFMTAFSSTDRD